MIAGKMFFAMQATTSCFLADTWLEYRSSGTSATCTLSDGVRNLGGAQNVASYVYRNPAVGASGLPISHFTHLISFIVHIVNLNSDHHILEAEAMLPNFRKYL